MPTCPTPTRLALALAAAAVTTGGLGACAATPAPNWEAQMGTSVRSIRAAQTLDPQATDRNGSTLTRHDGKAAILSSDRYANSFKEPPLPNIFTIGATTTGGGGDK